MAWSQAVERLPLGWICFTISLLLHIFKTIHAFDSFPSSTAVDEFRHHERVIPVLYSLGSKVDRTLFKGEHLEEITIVISSARKNFTLDLKINRELLSSAYVKRRPHINGYHIHKPAPDHKKSHCFYHGQIRDLPHSMAAVSTCNGISGFWMDQDEYYHLEPAPHSSQFVHLMYRDTDRKHNNFSCGYDEKQEPLSSIEQAQSLVRRVRRDVYGPYDSNADSRYVELFLVNDYRLSQATGADREHRSKEITNIVSRLYRPLNIYVALVGVEVWDQTDQVVITPDPNATLDNFLRYRRERINPYHPNDNAQLLTGVTFKDGVVGKAVKGPICTYRYSGGVNMDYSSLVSSVATTVAHEMGHNFGMQHDNDKCVCPQDRCIMASISGSASPNMWSSCSKEAVADAFRHGMDYCLRNKPKQLFGGPVCGNGFVEEGEQCDCGLPEACDNKCCNATSCTFTPIAVCATGECCDKSTCMLIPEATECRAAKGPCDFAEYCDGKKEFCPADVYVENGLQCKDGAAYCYDGQCNTPTDQCQLLWGPSGKVSDDICFTQLNTEGKNIGNCGYDWETSTYVRCRQKDVMCGMLHCVHLNEKLMFWKDVYALSFSATFLEMSDGRKKYVCRGAVLDVGMDLPDPGMVPNGAKCAENKMCVNQTCIKVSSLPGKGQCFRKCNGHGTCNSKGNCHCDPGYAPPLCAEFGQGCSVDSGPCRHSLDKRGLLTGMLMLFLVIIPLIIVLIVAYCKRQELKRWWKKQSFLKYRVPSIGKPPPQPSVQTVAQISPSVTPAGSTRENKFRSVSFRTGNPPSISNPVLKSSTNRNSQVVAGSGSAMETFKPADDPNSPIYKNVPPPRPPPFRPRSLHEDMPPQVEFAGARSSVNRNISLREQTHPPPPPPQKFKPRINQQPDVLQLQDNTDKKCKFENSRLALKPTVGHSSRPGHVSPTRSPPPPPNSPPPDAGVSALKARFDKSGLSGGTVNRDGSGTLGRSRAANKTGASHQDTAGKGGTGSTGRGGKSGVAQSHPTVGRSNSQNKPKTPPKPPNKADKPSLR
ncbi:disintegrin and metalloproteinase domain-containing protein 12-like [Liolophura sinensis]|uniref:disintegrin and metalloproteinase domain-containing protein 12-like n=1 Tax=Liolophura sinensis TaxID=3198878 RepID=UPI0031593826